MVLLNSYETFCDSCFFQDDEVVLFCFDVVSKIGCLSFSE